MTRIKGAKRVGRLTLGIWGIAALIPGCSATVGGGGGGDRSEGGAAGSDEVSPGQGGANSGEPFAPGTMSARRLTALELANAYEDLLGPGVADLSLIPIDTVGMHGFASSTKVGPVEAAHFETLAEKASVSATGSTNFLSDVPACLGAKKDQPACIAAFVDTFGTKAFRRTLLDGESKAFAGLFDTLRNATPPSSFNDALAGVVEAMLQSPQFLYHWELAGGSPNVQDGVIKLTPFEVASRLSFAIWSSPPDTQLLARAKSGGLQTVSDVKKELDRMVADKRFVRAVVNFHRQWLKVAALTNVTKDKKIYPSFSADLAKDMLAETDAFVGTVIGEEGSFDELFTARFSFIGTSLAPTYGVNANGVTATKISLPPQRSGIFTLGAFLSMQANPGETSPVKRGKVLLDNVLCRPVPPPPANVNNTPPPPDPNKQTRDQFEMHSKDALCAACHTAMDPLGFAFEMYDGVGGYRPMEKGRPVNTTGKIELDGQDVTFKDAPDLLSKLSKSNDVASCYVRQWLRFMTGRMEADGEESTITNAMTTFASRSHDVREMVKALASAETFLYRTPSAGEPLQ